MSILLPEDRPDEEAAILEQLKRGHRVQHFETVRVRKDGRKIDVSLSISPMRDREGVIRGASHVARDISERKTLEGKLLNAQKLESLGVLAAGLRPRAVIERSSDCHAGDAFAGGTEALRPAGRMGRLRRSLLSRRARLRRRLGAPGGLAGLALCLASAAAGPG